MLSRPFYQPHLLFNEVCIVKINPNSIHHFCTLGFASIFSLVPVGSLFAQTFLIGGYGDGPCHVSVDATGEFLAIANYSSGSVVVCPISSDGAINPATSNVQHSSDGTNKQRQVKAHAHCSFWDPTNRYLFVSDLGLDKVFVYDLNRETGDLTATGFSAKAPAPACIKFFER